jgi:hypothetical protein
MTNTLTIPAAFTANVRGQAFKVEGLHDMPEASIAKIFEYGLQRIFNDAAAGAKQGDKEEALALAQKKLDNLRAGIIRATGDRSGDPVRKRALELATAVIKVNPKVIAWAQASGLKMGDKAVVAKVAELARDAVEKDENQFIVQAKKDVEAASALSGLEIEL